MRVGWISQKGRRLIRAFSSDSRGQDVAVLTAHKILIASAVALFLGYGIWELLGYPDPGGSAALLRSGLSGMAAVGLGLYLRFLFRR